MLTRLESAGLASADCPNWTLHVDALREVVLDILARNFEPGIRYPEVDVNEKLIASSRLRRTAPLSGRKDFLARENGLSRRAGGGVEI